ncbi:hypothetical protein PVAP13_1KG504300 [Panicum virgatum]|uniref:Uncharacterized protein n=1 Tax=Panicum virgatum TaxID=38727 RepID=A0A8T0XJK5_PANVG|nr:hypothetical protein PVAP13_1KG504300 [Panicum virgatum]
MGIKEVVSVRAHLIRRTRGLFQISSPAGRRGGDLPWAEFRPAQWLSLLGLLRRIETRPATKRLSRRRPPLSSVAHSSVVPSPLPPKSKPYDERRRLPPPTRHLPCRLHLLSYGGDRRGFHVLALRGIAALGGRPSHCLPTACSAAPRPLTAVPDV